MKNIKYFNNILNIIHIFFVIKIQQQKMSLEENKINLNGQFSLLLLLNIIFVFSYQWSFFISINISNGEEQRIRFKYYNATKFF